MVGDDTQTLNELSEQLVEQLEQVSGLMDVTSHGQDAAQELHVAVDRDLAVVFQVELRQSTKFMARLSATQLRDYLGLIRRGQHVTVLYRMRSTKKEGEWLGRQVLARDKENEIKIFGASIF